MINQLCRQTKKGKHVFGDCEGVVTLVIEPNHKLGVTLAHYGSFCWKFVCVQGWDMIITKATIFCLDELSFFKFRLEDAKSIHANFKSRQ